MDKKGERRHFVLNTVIPPEECKKAGAVQHLWQLMYAGSSST